jgi:chaperonin cofactor prefoldin
MAFLIALGLIAGIISNYVTTKELETKVETQSYQIHTLRNQVEILMYDQ